MAVNVNRAGYERRLAVVKQLLHSRGLQPSNISTLAYKEELEWPSNNYLYKVELAPPATSSSFPGTQPGTTKAPSDGISVLVIKLSNLAAYGLNNNNRVENDIAVQHLVRQSMARAGVAPLVPAVYAWAPATATDTADENCFGWTISELKSGVNLVSEFSSLNFEDKEQVLEQIAAVLAAIQSARLPEGVTKFGGLTFDLNGQIVSAESPRFKWEPVGSYIEWTVASIRSGLQSAAQSPVIQGWKTNGLDVRIENFVTSGGLEKVLNSVDLHQKSLIHSDFTTNNMLFDKRTMKITAVLDFDFSYVSNPTEEFTTLLGNLGCNITHGDTKIKAAILSGNFTTRPDNLDEEYTKKWEVVKAWNTAMKKSGVVSLSDIKGASEILDVIWFADLLCPWQLANGPWQQGMLKGMKDEEKAELRAKTEADLVQWLEKYGF